ncbi:hypothetical protein ACEWY4_024667 [Coilia grayii]|uniref:Uncharacterized protein n=1 Tax=Coilia grayii TaxID=363190 RepID=A0ABD1IVC6_9TELE
MNIQAKSRELFMTRVRGSYSYEEWPLEGSLDTNPNLSTPVKLCCVSVTHNTCVITGTNSTHPYVLVSPGKNWTDAQRYCREKHTDLASVRNQTENKQIASVRGSGNGHVWIGLFRDAWEWSDGSSSSFRHWSSGEPNFSSGTPANDFCTLISPNGLWYDSGCHAARSFICYEALPTVGVVSPRSPFYSGDAVTLRCDIPKYTDWHQYVWLKDNSTVPGKTTQTITITLPQDAGQYQCSGQREGRSNTSSPSGPVTIKNNGESTFIIEY